jgi:hypothetical protein
VTCSRTTASGAWNPPLCDPLITLKDLKAKP